MLDYKDILNKHFVLRLSASDYFTLWKPAVYVNETPVHGNEITNSWKETVKDYPQDEADAD